MNACAGYFVLTALVLFDFTHRYIGQFFEMCDKYRDIENRYYFKFLYWTREPRQMRVLKSNDRSEIIRNALIVKKSRAERFGRKHRNCNWHAAIQRFDRFHSCTTFAFRSDMSLRNQLRIFSCFVIFDCFVVFGNASETKLKLETVQVLFRHGARAPLVCEAELLSNGNDSLYDPWGIAQLTNKGMMQEYKIGKMLRDRYKDFLPDTYKKQDVFAYASGTPRTQASLQLLLAALYPPTKQLKWNDQLNWMPIPVRSNPRPLDILMKSRLCPAFGKALYRLLNTDEMLDKIKNHRWILQRMREIYWKSFDIRDTFCAYNAVKVHKEMNLPMPSWYTDEIYAALNEAKEFYLKAMSYTNVLKKLNGGPMVRRFLENMKETPWKINKRKMYLYSAHDKTLHAFLKVHEIPGVRQPDYGSTVILEKYRGEQNEIYVKFLYWPGEQKQINTITLTNCTEMCPFEKYVQMIKPYLPSDDDMLCLYKDIKPEQMERIINPDTAIAEGKGNYVI